VLKNITVVGTHMITSYISNFDENTSMMNR